MNLFFRLLRVLLAAWRAKRRLSLSGQGKVHVGIGSADLDQYGAIEATRFASFADLGIVDFLERTGVMGLSRKNGWAPLLAARDIELLDIVHDPKNVSVTTRLIGWDERYTFFVHELVAGDTPVAIVRSTGRISSRKDKQPIVEKVLQGLGLPTDTDAGVPADFADMVARITRGREAIR
ncbi:MAG: thioesterase family protein [Pseudomonadota bacterium]